MTDIPEDIEKKVREVRNQLCLEYECTFDAGCECREVIARAILAERERDRWLPIAGAPKDGTEIIAYGSYLYPGDRDITEYWGVISFENGRWQGETSSYSDGVWSHYQPAGRPSDVEQYPSRSPERAGE